MNTENCNQLLAWLDAGAPHAVFHMNSTNIRVAAMDHDQISDYTLDQQKTKGIGPCGTACCIAGAAVGMAHGDISKPLPPYSWVGLQVEALEFLELERNCQDHGHNLFNPYLCPEDCTPDQAAEALRRVMRGEEPWS